MCWFFKKQTFIFLFLFLIITNISASEVDTLLNDFTHKNDLSQKTIDENKGHLVLFTREKLEDMNAKTLKDVFKTAPVIYYHENRYGLPDPLASGAFEPYRSNFIRLYVDGVEITQGWMGSGVVLYGDINIDFVDHIEFYYMTPSFETSVEPAYLTIFLYSKDPKRDGGGKIGLMQGSRGHNTQSVSYGEEKENFSYMVNLSRTDAKREKIDNGTDRPLSRDFTRTQLFSYIKTDTQIFHLQLLKKDTDSLAGLSLDATPLQSEVDYLNLHMDYSIAISENWRAQFTYEWLKTNIRQMDDTALALGNQIFSNSLHTENKNSVYTGELTYKNTIGNNHITTGIKGRLKTLDLFDIEEVTNEKLVFDKESILSLFFQNQYVLSEDQLITLGLEYSKILRNGSINDDELYQLRLGYIYSSEKWNYKTYLYRTMFALDPFGRYLHLSEIENTAPQSTIGITQEFSYKNDNNYARIMFLMMQDKNGLLENDGTGKTQYFFTIFNYNYLFDINNKIDIQLYYARYKDIANVDRLDDYSGYFSTSNKYENFNFYNAVVWHQNSIDYVHYFDVTSSISWNASENLTFTLQGENLLNKAKETNLFRINPTTGALLAPLSISPIDQRITLEMEYTF